MILGTWRVAFAAVGILALLGAVDAGAASAPRKFKDWSLYEHQDDNGKTCFITTVAIKQEGAKNEREAPRLFVTRFPVPSPNEQVMVDPGYRYKPDTGASLGIDKKSFDLLVKDDKAWGKSPADDEALVQAMKRGNQAIARGTSTIGTTPADTYSLVGFSAAYEALDKACSNAGRR